MEQGNHLASMSDSLKVLGAGAWFGWHWNRGPDMYAGRPLGNSCDGGLARSGGCYATPVEHGANGSPALPSLVWGRMGALVSRGGDSIHWQRGLPFLGVADTDDVDGLNSSMPSRPMLANKST